jgi:hypothetical protein
VEAKAKISNEATDSRTQIIIEVVRISLNKEMIIKITVKSVRILSIEVVVVEGIIIGVIIKETKMMLIKNHKMHRRDKTSLTSNLMTMNINKDLLVKEIKTKH